MSEMPKGPVAGRMTLVAMPRSGEILLIRDASGSLWIIHPPGAGPAEMVDETAIGQAVAKHDWDLVEETYDSWEDLDAGRQARAAKLAPGRDLGIADYDAVDVRELLDYARARAATGDVDAARVIATRLLTEVRAVRDDSELAGEVQAVLDNLPAGE